MTLATIALRNLVRNRTRVALVTLAMAFAVFTFTVLRTLVSSWTAQADVAARTRVVTRHKLTVLMKLPLRYVEQVRKVPHVLDVGYGVWFGGRVPTRENDFFMSVAIDPGWLDAYGSSIALPAEQREAFVKDRRGAVVGRAVADKFGWKVGDRVQLKSGNFPTPEGAWDFTIRGIFTSPTPSPGESWFFVRYDSINDAQPPARRDQIGAIVSRVDSGANSAAVSHEIDRIFADRELQTLSQDEQAYNKSGLASAAALLRAIDVASLALVATMLLLVGNAISMGARERASEYATLRALGFSARALAALVVGEATALALAGGLLGLAMAYTLVQFGLGPALEQNMGNFVSSFRVPPSAFASVFALVVALGLGSGALPALGAARLRGADALRSGTLRAPPVPWPPSPSRTTSAASPPARRRRRRPRSASRSSCSSSRPY
jgi:putative ABC transport system permease protein